MGLRCLARELRCAGAAAGAPAHRVCTVPQAAPPRLHARARGVLRSWVPEMQAAGVEWQHWRKSSMWGMLIRKHAQAVADDEKARPAARRIAGCL